ncbi:MAG TPA: hypothetical protein VFV50_02005 [Bdellovibrionales bacterium]|nr:hypothetical protein [Bdellovibrionales bacterium]
MTTTEQIANPTTLPPVASNVFTACKKCGVDRYHKVLAHKTETSAQVQCEVCKAKKTYKLPKPPKVAKAKKPRKASAKTPAGPTWQALKDEIGTDSIQPYKMSANFKAKSAINHPKFGVGFVTVSLPQKIEVVFEASTISLVHNRQ